MAQSEDGKNITDGISEEGFIVLGSTLLENGHIIHDILWDLIGSISATSSITATCSVSRKLIGSVSANSSLSGTLSRARPLAGTISSTASVSGAITKFVALAGSISALSAPRLHIMRRRAYLACHQVRLFDVIPGVLSMQWSLKGGIPATSSVSGALRVHWSLKGAITAISAVSGSIIESTYLAGLVSANSAISGTLTSSVYITGVISATSSLQGILSDVASEQGFYYAKLGSTILTNIEKDSFRITEELNKIPSFEFEIANCSDNRTAIAAGITDTFTIYRRIDSTDTLMFTGLLNTDAIEYLSLERIRITGYASYVDLNWRLHQHLNSEDAETVDKVYNYTGSYSDKTTEANNDTINDVPITYSSVNDALYVGQSEQFFGMQVKYSTKGVQAASTTVVFEYSKGSSVWATLDVLDESRAFTEDAGTYYITIPHKPSDWAKDTVNSVKKFWIRARLSAGSYTTTPALDRIKITNIDVYMVYYRETSANTIMDEILAGTGYSMDVTDACPSTEISIVAEYETKLRMIPGVVNALTWDDSGDKKGYQWWIVDATKKVHIKQKRGAILGDITGELTILNNVEDYFNLTNRLHIRGNYDGLSGLRAIIEDRSSQDTHEIRELVMSEERYNNYIPLKEAAQKAMTYTKAPLQKIAATLKTKYWLDTALEVGDTVTLLQDTWNVDSTAFQIVRADIGPRVTNLDMGISQDHLDGLKAGLQRQMDISGIRMHGSTLILQFGPDEMNYQRVDDTTVYPSRLKFEIPSDARYIHKVVISWKMGNYRADVSGGEESEAHDHTGAAGAGGAHDHAGYAGAGGAHDSEVLDGGLHTPVSLSEAHQHSVQGTGSLSYNSYLGYIVTDPITYNQDPATHYHTWGPTQSGGAHSHTNPTTGTASQGHVHSIPHTDEPDDVADAVTDIYYGSHCDVGDCVDWADAGSFGDSGHWHYFTSATGSSGSGHTHNQGVTGLESAHTHGGGNTTHSGTHTHNVEVWQDTEYNIAVHPINLSLDLVTSAEESPAHVHAMAEVAAHPHTAVAIAAHANHVIGNQIAHGDHTIISQAAAMIDLVLGIVEVAGGTTMMLIVNGETVASDYNGDQTDVVITGYTNTGSNTVEIQPIVGANTKGGISAEGRGVLFIETSSF